MLAGIAEIMRAFAHIIVDQHDGHWTVWWPAEAVRRLLDALGSTQFDPEEIVAFDEATADGHLEFRVPYRNRWRIPAPSQN